MWIIYGQKTNNPLLSLIVLKIMGTLHKVFSILETVVAGQDIGVTYSEIVTKLGLAKSSVHRILKDLTELGYINFNPETKRYFGSLRLAAIGAEIISSFDLRDHVRPHLISLHKETGYTTHLGILDGTKGVFIDKIVSRDFNIKLFSEIGKRFPLHCTGLGKVLLAYSPDGLSEEVCKSPLERITKNTITEPSALKKELMVIKKRGYSLDNQEITRGLMCVAAPIFGFNEELVGAISVAIPTYINEDRGIEREITAVKNYSSLMSKTIGFK
jgi:DNA-binding IclR family transcriptional regulator